MRRPHRSELIKSDDCQSGPASSSTTFLPARLSSAANTDPDAPAPMMTASTFSFAISPPLVRSDMRHVGDAEIRISLHGPIDDVDGIAAQQQIDKHRRR